MSLPFCLHHTAASSVEVSILAQEHILVRRRYEAFRLIFKASMDGQLRSCISFESNFVVLLSQEMQNFKSVREVAYTLVNLEDAREHAVLFSKAYSFYTSRVIARKDIVKVQTALATKWEEETSGMTASI